MTRDDFMTIAWRDFVLWAWGEPDMRASFTADTGISIPAPAKTPLDAMIDEATGVQEDCAAKFVDWVTINHWGADEAPEAWKAKHP